MDKPKLSPAEERIALAKGKRLKRVRHLLNVNQAVFAQMLSYSRASINYWEKAHNGGLTFEGAMAAIEAAKENGLVCHLEWLMFGEGPPPYLMNEQPAGIVLDNIEPHAIAQHAEIDFFKRNTEGSVIFTIEENDACFPFAQGDVLGGVWCSVDQTHHNKKYLALIDSKKHHPFCLCMIKKIHDNHFYKSTLTGTEKKKLTLKKFVRITRWWAQ